MIGAAVATASPTATPPSAGDDATALPSWLLIVLICLVAVLIIGMFGLTWFNLSAPRSTLKSILGVRMRFTFGRTNATPGRSHGPMLSQSVIDALGRSARVGKRTTRTTLAITGFSLLGLGLIAVLGLSGTGVRDLRTQLISSLVTLVAAIAGFYFGSQTSGATAGDAGNGARSDSASSAPPTISAPAAVEATVGQPIIVAPTLTGAPPPRVRITEGTLPTGLSLDETTGAITGVAPDRPQSFGVTLTAANGQAPDTAARIQFTINASGDGANTTGIASVP